MRSRSLSAENLMNMTTATHGYALKKTWDAYDVYLFDIDGTLLNCTDAVHYFAFCAALESLSGRALNLDGVTTHGNTDAGILRDALKLAKVSEEQWRPRIGEAQTAMCRFVEERRRDLCITVLPGVTAILDHLRARGAALGVATGNIAGIGQVKLAHGALLDYFDFGGYSDGYEFRHEVFKGALEKARALAGAEASVCVIGDTPEDIRAARANELDVIAVATGTFSFEELEAGRPDWCLRSLEELIAKKA
jgi:phosphoglycolate phosphatase-like HAD superfamily hydrolase